MSWVSHHRFSPRSCRRRRERGHQFQFNPRLGSAGGDGCFSPGMVKLRPLGPSASASAASRVNPHRPPPPEIPICLLPGCAAVPRLPWPDSWPMHSGPRSEPTVHSAASLAPARRSPAAGSGHIGSARTAPPPSGPGSAASRRPGTTGLFLCYSWQCDAPGRSQPNWFWLSPPNKTEYPKARWSCSPAARHPAARWPL